LKESNVGREVSLFADYHNTENSVTNYCGLALKLLYREHPDSFAEVITSLVSDEINLTIGPVFRQQTKKAVSIPDLSITQRAFAIFFETKLTDWFYLDQIRRHMEGFAEKGDLKILFLLSNFESDDLGERFANECKQAKKHGIVLQPISFEDFVGTLESVKSSDAFKAILEEFKVYLDRNGHLPKWKGLLDVVSCKSTLNEISAGAYMCPDTGGAYSHRRAKFFGPYARKRVAAIHEIRALVVVGIKQEDCSVRWKNVAEPDSTLKEQALATIPKWDYRIKENAETPLQVFLLGPGHETDFRKSTSGGMWQSKKYFWNIAEDCKTADELASKLRGKTWEEYEK
jgi:hypothetical protein